MTARQLLTATAACLLMAGCATTDPSQPFQVWKDEKGQDVLALYVRFTSGAPLNAASVGPAAISKDDQGFVSIQVPLTNNSPMRKTANVGWEWKKADGMVARSPLGSTLRNINIAGRDTQLVRSVSSAPEPRIVTLTIHPAN